MTLFQDEYEIVGDTVGANGVNVHHAPRRSRTELGHQGLFKNFEICCFGQFDMLQAGKHLSAVCHINT